MFIVTTCPVVSASGEIEAVPGRIDQPGSIILAQQVALFGGPHLKLSIPVPHVFDRASPPFRVVLVPDELLTDRMTLVGLQQAFPAMWCGFDWLELVPEKGDDQEYTYLFGRWAAASRHVHGPQIPDFRLDDGILMRPRRDWYKPLAEQQAADWGLSS